MNKYLMPGYRIPNPEKMLCRARLLEGTVANQQFQVPCVVHVTSLKSLGDICLRHLTLYSHLLLLLQPLVHITILRASQALFLSLFLTVTAGMTAMTSTYIR